MNTLLFLSCGAIKYIKNEFTSCEFMETKLCVALGPNLWIKYCSRIPFCNFVIKNNEFNKS